MENISKAMMIVGGMLLAVLILTLLVFLFNRISVIPQEQSQQHGEIGIIEYNKSYEVYQKPLMYGTDIISVVNKAVDHNMRNGLLNADSNFFSKSFVNSIYGELMTIDAKFKSKESNLDFNWRVRIYYIEKDDSGHLREKEYSINRGPAIHSGKQIGQVLSGKNYENIIPNELIKKNFMASEYAYDINTNKEFFKRVGNVIYLVAGDKDQDVKANKNLMDFLKAEPLTILNPDSKDKSWTRLVITPPSAKLKRLIFKSDVSKTEYYQNGRIKKMYFEEI